MRKNLYGVKSAKSRLEEDSKLKLVFDNEGGWIGCKFFNNESLTSRSEEENDLPDKCRNLKFDKDGFTEGFNEYEESLLEDLMNDLRRGK